MTIETSVAEKPGLLKKGRKFMWSLVIALAIAAVVAWIALGIGLYMGVEFKPRLILAVAAALTTEGLFWTTAAALGVSVVEARKRIWRRITGRG